MPFRFNPFTDKLDLTETGGGPPGNSGLVFLDEQSANNSPNITFNNTFITPLYSKYLLLASNVTLDNPTPTLELLLSVDNGANYLTTGFIVNGAGADGYFLLNDDGNSFDNTVPLNGFYNLFNMNLNSYPAIVGQFFYSTNGTSIIANNSAGRGPANSTVNNIRIQLSSGNILTGDFSLYGYIEQ